MAANNKQKETISFCKDKGSECKPKQHYTVKDSKICTKLSDINSADHITATFEGYDEKYFQSRILGGLDRHNIEYGFMEYDCEKYFQEIISKFDKHDIDYRFINYEKMPNTPSESPII